MSPSKPSSIPITRIPCSHVAVLTTARITAFSPGASPPPVEIAIRMAAAGPCSVLAFLPPNQSDDFTRLCMAARRRLGKHQPVVHGHLEPPTGRWDELDARARELPGKLGRQTGGPGLVVSDDAILDDGAHAHSPRPIGGGGGGSNRSGGWAGLPGVAVCAASRCKKWRRLSGPRGEHIYFGHELASGRGSRRAHLPGVAPRRQCSTQKCRRDRCRRFGHEL